MTLSKTTYNLFRVLIIIIIVGVLAFGAYAFILYEKRQALAKGLHEYFAGKGVSISQDFLYNQFIRMTNRELNIMIKFMRALVNNDVPTIINYAPEASEIILQKTDAEIFGGLLSISKITPPPTGN